MHFALKGFCITLQEAAKWKQAFHCQRKIAFSCFQEILAFELKYAGQHSCFAGCLLSRGQREKRKGGWTLLTDIFRLIPNSKTDPFWDEEKAKNFYSLGLLNPPRRN